MSRLGAKRRWSIAAVVGAADAWHRWSSESGSARHAGLLVAATRPNSKSRAAVPLVARCGQHLAKAS
jgi:hypothetical protein